MVTAPGGGDAIGGRGPPWVKGHSVVEAALASAYSFLVHHSGRAHPVSNALPLKLRIPLVLGLAAAVVIAGYAELAFHRLETAKQHSATMLDIQATLQSVLKLVGDAETGQRGYVLTGKPEYLEPFTAALPKIHVEYQRLRQMIATDGSVADRASASRLYNLIGRKVGEVEATIALYNKEGVETAQKLVDTGIGKQTMDDIRAESDVLMTELRRALSDSDQQWRFDVGYGRAGMRVMAIAVIVLVLVLWFLLDRDARRSRVLQKAAETEKQDLEALVEKRTLELSELSNHLQVVREDEKARLARDIHDELGGILVSAKMDVAWAEQRVNKVDPEAASRLERAQQVLDDGIQVKRRIIEELRPTLLDNLGLAAALDWQLREVCDRAGLQCAFETPADFDALPPPVSIVAYRILQEALTNIVKHAKATRVDVTLTVAPDRVTLAIRDNGIGISDNAQQNALSHGLAGMRQRARAIHGKLSITRPPEGGTCVELRVPLEPSPQALEIPTQPA